MLKSLGSAIFYNPICAHWIGAIFRYATFGTSFQR